MGGWRAMYRLLRSKKAFSLIELMTVVLIMGILVAIAVPVYRVTVSKQRQKDCVNQIEVIKGNVAYVMGGLQDNGERILSIKLDAGLFMATGSGTDQYWLVKTGSMPTIAAMRYGVTKNDATAKSHLKKSSMASVSFITLFNYSELPVCPFDKAGTAGYRIYADGSVACNCSDCPNYGVKK